MLPKKGRREIVVDGVLYHYSIKGCVTVTIRNNESGKVHQHCEEWKRKWQKQMKPSDVELVIRNFF